MSKLISTHKGHTFRGQDKNPYNIYEDDKGKYVEMSAKNGSFIFDYSDLEYINTVSNNGKIRNLTWYLDQEKRHLYKTVYYVKTTINNKKIYIHQYLMKYWGHGSDGITIDHIDRNPLNNRRYNIRLVTRSEQNSNINKRHRGSHAVPLPKELDDVEIPKYVSYTRYKRNTKLGYYDLFIIQCHPAQKSIYSEKSKWITQMSMSVSIIDKFKQAITKLKQLDDKLIKQHIQIAGTS